MVDRRIPDIYRPRIVQFCHSSFEWLCDYEILMAVVASLFLKIHAKQSSGGQLSIQSKISSPKQECSLMESHWIFNMRKTTWVTLLTSKVFYWTSAEQICYKALNLSASTLQFLTNPILNVAGGIKKCLKRWVRYQSMLHKAQSSSEPWRHLTELFTGTCNMPLGWQIFFFMKCKGRAGHLKGYVILWT